MKPIIEVESLSKLYHLGLIGSTTLRDSAERLWYNLRGKKEELKRIGIKRRMIEANDPQAGPEPNTIWALKDISFSVQQGEILGIIGRNGSGKSTLLKILSRITEPTEGRAILRGRTSSLLEVGTGFHPELTGRENIYLNGAILGMRKAEIDRKFDDIVAFAEMEKFIDTPVKRYSSGMYVRLAFAVAAHLEPEILLVDEVLAVGDAAFQKRCIGKMGDIAEGGRTVVFVSHNMGAIAKLCQRCILLQAGKIQEEGPSPKVVACYLGGFISTNGERRWDVKNSMPGDKEFIQYKAVRIINSEGKISSFVYIDEPFHIEIEYEILQPLTNAWLGFQLSNAEGEVIFCSGDENFESQKQLVRPTGSYKSRCKIPDNFLNQNTYNISLLGHIPGVRTLVNENSVISFEVLRRQNITGPGKQPGIICPLLSWTVQRVE